MIGVLDQHATRPDLHPVTLLLLKIVPHTIPKYFVPENMGRFQRGQ